MKVSIFKIAKIIFTVLIIHPYNIYSQIDGNNWNNENSIDAEIDNFKNYTIEDNCTTTLNPINRFNGNVETVNNINEAGLIDINNTQGGIVNIYGNAYFSPQLQVLEFRKIFREELDLFFAQKLIPTMEDLSKNTSKLNESVNLIVESLKNLDKPIYKKREYLQIASQYRTIIYFSKCLHQDYGEEAIIKKDISGEEIYLFELEKIWDDPNYFFKGSEKEGFVLVKKFNKYGYHSKNPSYQDIPFKYSKATDFTNGYAVVEDSDSHHVIDKTGNEILSYSKRDTELITILEDGIFIKHGTEESGSNNSFFVDKKGEILSRKYDRIKSHDLNNIFRCYWDEFHEIEGVPNNYNISSYSYLADNKAKRFRLSYRDVKLLNKEYSIKVRSNFNFKQIMLLPDNSRLLFVIKINGINNKIFLLLKNLKTGEIISHKRTNEKVFSKIKNINQQDSYSTVLLKYSIPWSWSSVTNPIIEYNSKAFKKLKKIPHPSFIEDKGELKNKFTIYNIEEHRSIGVSCFNVSGVFSDIRLVQFSKKLIVVKEVNKNTSDSIHTDIRKEVMNDSLNEEGAEEISFEFADEDLSSEIIEGYGLMDFNGQIVIPPLFNKITYQKEQGYFELKDYNENSYIININWNCISGKCEDYRQLVREYYPLRKD